MACGRGRRYTYHETTIAKEVPVVAISAPRARTGTSAELPFEGRRGRRRPPCSAPTSERVCLRSFLRSDSRGSYSPPQVRPVRGVGDRERLSSDPLVATRQEASNDTERRYR
jgi:hypothetical protein